MVHSLVYRPLPALQAQRLFEQIFLSSSHYPNKWEGEETISLFFIIDSIVGLMRLPYLYKEAERIYQTVDKGDYSFTLRYEVLALIANGAEVHVWCAERKFIILSPRCSGFLQGISYISRIILYEEAVFKEGRVLRLIWREEAYQNKGYSQLKMELISHTAYLGWVTLSLITHLTGRSYPRRYMKLLHFVSFYFGLIATAYNEGNPTLYKKFIRYLPKESIYCF